MGALDHLSQRVLTPFYNRWNGNGEINAQTRRWRSLLEMSYEDAQKVERGKLSELLKTAYETTEFYRERFDRAGVTNALDDPEALGEIPLLTKAEVRTDVKSLINSSVPETELMETHTGGSTGDPMYFFRDKNVYCERWGLQNAANMRLGWNPGEWHALVWGAAHDLPGEYTTKYRVVNYLVHKRIIVNAGMLNEELVDWFVGQLRKHRPRVIYGYAMMINLIAEALGSSGAKFPRPEIVVTTAETLTRSARETIEKVFDASVINRYATREFGVIADQCPGAPFMRVVPASLKIEVLPLSENDPNFGELIITDLLNKAMPFIRYRSGDVGRLTVREVDGRRGLYLSELSGRVSDFIVTPGGRVISSIALLPDFFVPHPHIRQAQVIQRGSNDFTILVISEKTEPTRDDGKRIVETFENFCGERLKVRVEFVREIPRDTSGKVRFIKSEVSPRLFDDRSADN